MTYYVRYAIFFLICRFQWEIHTFFPVDTPGTVLRTLLIKPESLILLKCICIYLKKNRMLMVSHANISDPVFTDVLDIFFYLSVDIK